MPNFTSMCYIAILLFITQLLSNATLAQDICSPDGRTTLKEMNTNLQNLEKYCLNKSAKDSNKKLYDLSSKDADFAELIDDLGNGKGVDSQIKFNLISPDYLAPNEYCSPSISKFQDKMLVSCTARPDQNIFIYSANRETRLNLIKKRTSKPQPLLVTGTILGYSAYPIIEIK